MRCVLLSEALPEVLDQEHKTRLLVLNPHIFGHFEQSLQIEALQRIHVDLMNALGVTFLNIFEAHTSMRRIGDHGVSPVIVNTDVEFSLDI